MNRIHTSWLIAIAVLSVATMVLAADIGNSRTVRPVTDAGYVPNTNTAAYRTGLLGSDEADLANGLTTGLDKVFCEGFQTLTVHGRFTSASATCVVSVIRYNQSDTVVGVQEFTLTAKARSTLSSKYFSNATAVDTEGCEYVRVIVQAPSAGTIDLWVGAY